MKAKCMRLLQLGLVGVFFATVLVTQSGCSVAMAAKQPPKKNIEILKEGMPRALVVAEFGNPVSSDTKEGKKVEVYSFTQGYSKPAKIGRCLFHAVADIFTFCLWEVVGTPTELAFDGKKMVSEVTYDASDKIEKVVMLQK